MIDRLHRRLCAGASRGVSTIDDLIDAGSSTASSNWLAGRTVLVGLSLRRVQTGRLRQYVMFIVVGTVALFVLISFFWSYAVAG